MNESRLFFGAAGARRLRRAGPLAPFLAVLLAALFAALSPAWGAAAQTDRPVPPAGSSWLDGAEGFARALDQALAEKKPLAVYFYTDWCGYCRQLERELLFRDELVDYLGNLTTVRINPERGRQEASIAQRYGVFGYPAFFVHPGPGHEAEKVSGRVKRDGRWQMQTPEELIETLNGIVGRAK